jgi:transposase
MHQPHKAGEKLFVDYAVHIVPMSLWETVLVVNPATGEIRHIVPMSLREAQIFVATLGASNYTYAEAQWSQDLPNWIGGHMQAFAFFGGDPEILIPDNLKTGISLDSFSCHAEGNASWYCPILGLKIVELEEIVLSGS